MLSLVRRCFTNCPRLHGCAGLDTANAVWVYRPSGVQIPEPPRIGGPLLPTQPASASHPRPSSPRS